MRHCPKHIESLLEEANYRFPDEQDNYHHYFALKCPCGGDKFSLVQGSKRSLVAACERCKRQWRLYDLAHYTSASKGKGEEVFDRVIVSDEQPARLFIGYEYGETDEDEEFDRDDITWCSVFVEKGMKPEKVFDDETA